MSLGLWGMSEVWSWVCVGVWFRRKRIKMSLHNLWLRRLLSSSHFRDPLPSPADMLNIEWGQNFCLEPLLASSPSNTSMCARMGTAISSHKAWTHTCTDSCPLYSHDRSHGIVLHNDAQAHIRDSTKCRVQPLGSRTEKPLILSNYIPVKWLTLCYYFLGSHFQILSFRII